MQQKSDSSATFLDRSSVLAVRLSLSVVQCCKKIGISRSLFYEIRDGKREVTDKMMARLEQAEKDAGIFHSLGDVLRVETQMQRGEYVSPAAAKEVARIREEVMPERMNETSLLIKLFLAWFRAQGISLSDEDLDLPLEELTKKLKPPAKS